MDTNRVADLTIEEFRALIRSTVREVLEEMIDDDDPDERLEFRPKVADYLRSALQNPKRGTPLADVIRQYEQDASQRQDQH